MTSFASRRFTRHRAATALEAAEEPGQRACRLTIGSGLRAIRTRVAHDVVVQAGAGVRALAITRAGRERADGRFAAHLARRAIVRTAAADRNRARSASRLTAIPRGNRAAVLATAFAGRAVLGSVTFDACLS